MKKIIFLNNWGHTPKQSLDRYKLQTPDCSGVWDDIEGVTEIDDADYYIILDGYKHYKKLESNKKIYLQREPPVIVSKHDFKNDSAKYIGSYDKHYHVATWQLKIPFDELVNLTIPEKTKIISTVTSNKIATKAQKRRVEVAKMLQQNIHDMDFYGRGFKPLDQNDYCKKEGLLKYKYSFACENCSVPNYFTEKIIDCILCWTKPIYWGCPNISKYLPKGSYISIDIFKNNIVDIIKEEIQKPVNYDIMREARELILNRYNIWPSIKKIIGEVDGK